MIRTIYLLLHTPRITPTLSVHRDGTSSTASEKGTWLDASCISIMVACCNDSVIDDYLLYSGNQPKSVNEGNICDFFFFLSCRVFFFFSCAVGGPSVLQNSEFRLEGEIILQRRGRIISNHGLKSVV